MAELALAQARTQANLDRTEANLDRLADELRGLAVQSRQDGKEVDRRLGELSTRMSEQSAELTNKMREQSAELSTKMGEVANRMGRLVEDIVAPSIPACFQTLFGAEDPEWFVRVKKRHRDSGSLREFDVVVWSGGVFLVNSTKSRVRNEDIEPFVALLPEMRAYFPEAEDRKVVGSLASFYLEPSIVRAAERAGLIVFGLGGGLLELLNSPGFKPREF